MRDSKRGRVEGVGSCTCIHFSWNLLRHAAIEHPKVAAILTMTNMMMTMTMILLRGDNWSDALYAWE